LPPPVARVETGRPPVERVGTGAPPVELVETPHPLVEPVETPHPLVELVETLVPACFRLSLVLTAIVVLIGLVGALIFGAADFLGGVAAKRISSIRVTAIAAVAGLVALLLALPFVGGEWSADALLYGAISGITGAGSIVLLYACLAIGPMSILSPLTAVVSAIVPMTAGLLRGERLEPLAYLALGLALVAVVLVGFVPERNAVRPSAKALAMATGSGALIGTFMILIDLTPDDSGLVPLIANRAVNATIMVTTIAVLALITVRRSRLSLVEPVETPPLVELVETSSEQRHLHASPRALDPSTMVAETHSPHPWLAGLKLAIICGILDAVANSLLLLGLRLGELTIMSVLTAMYSAGTIILAAIVLKERLTPSQIVGLVLALAAAAMLATV
jgi:drug/metabolite transporter (DMT)-like permease